MKITNFTKLIEHQFADLYSAEKQLVVALPKLVKSATSPKLKKGFEDHLEQTKVHVTRLEEAAKEANISMKSVICKGMKGLVAEGEEAIESIDEGALLDAALIGAAQKVEHYEIMTYTTLINHLKEAGFPKAVKILQKTLAEEEKTSDKLTTVAKEVDPKAAVDLNK